YNETEIQAHQCSVDRLHRLLPIARVLSVSSAPKVFPYPPDKSFWLNSKAFRDSSNEAIRPDEHKFSHHFLLVSKPRPHDQNEYVRVKHGEFLSSQIPYEQLPFLMTRKSSPVLIPLKSIHHLTLLETKQSPMFHLKIQDPKYVYA